MIQVPNVGADHWLQRCVERGFVALDPSFDFLLESIRERTVGLFGAQVNVTDGRYVYMRNPASEDNLPLSEYTHMPTHMRSLFTVEEMQDVELGGPFTFTKGCRVMKIPGGGDRKGDCLRTMLFDLQSDPGQERPIDDPRAEKTMLDRLVAAMRESDAPPELYTRLGLS